MENQESVLEITSMMKPCKNDPIFCTLNFSPIEPLISLGCDWFEIEIFFFFRRWHEIHFECKNPNSASEEDHHILWREPAGKLYTAYFIITPYKLECLEDYIKDGVASCEKEFPTYVTPGVVSYIQAKLLQYLYEYMEFDGELKGLRFDIDVMVDVSTVDLGHDLGDDGHPLLRKM